MKILNLGRPLSEYSIPNSIDQKKYKIFVTKMDENINKGGRAFLLDNNGDLHDVRMNTSSSLPYGTICKMEHDEIETFLVKYEPDIYKALVKAGYEDLIKHEKSTLAMANKCIQGRYGKDSIHHSYIAIYKGKDAEIKIDYNLSVFTAKGVRCTLVIG